MKGDTTITEVASVGSSLTGRLDLVFLVVNEASVRPVLKLVIMDDDYVKDGK